MRQFFRHGFFLGALGAGVAATVLVPARSEAALVAAYAEGHAGMSSANANEISSAGTSAEGAVPGLGLQLGARVLIFEGYFDHTALSGRSTVNRGIFGLRGAVGANDLRLIFRGGVGAIGESGGALTGPTLDGTSRVGGVARLGLSLENRVAPTLYLGVNLDAETFAFPATRLEPAVRGSDIFLSLGLKFELGI